ncbi:MAG TPA: alpha-L-fucosidase [Steroidobacteraceae bacterium]
MSRAATRLLVTLACAGALALPAAAASVGGHDQSAFTTGQPAAVHSAKGNEAAGLRLSAAKMQWWRDAKLGIMVHWGLYAIPAQGEWYEYARKVPPARYAALAKRFEPKHFDPNRWAALARRAGAGYMVMTARHHDGFALFDSPCSQDHFDSMHSAAHEDFIAAYVEAARRHGLRVGIYYSLLDWRFPGYFHPVRLAANAALMKQEVYCQVRELMSHYGKISVLWYDGGWLRFRGTDADAAWFWQPDALNGMVRKLQPDVVINPRSGWQGDFDTEEGAAPITGPVRSKPWEKVFTLGAAWGYTASGNTLPAPKVIRLIVAAVTRNGNALVNVGPDRDGVIPPPQARVLEQLGAWMGRYGDSLRGTRPGPYQPVDGVYGSTVRGDDIYIHVLSWPGAQLRFPRLAQTVLSASVMGGGKISFTQSSTGLTVSVPPAERHSIDTIVLLTTQTPAASLAP